MRKTLPPATVALVLAFLSSANAAPSSRFSGSNAPQPPPAGLIHCGPAESMQDCQDRAGVKARAEGQRVIFIKQVGPDKSTAHVYYPDGRVAVHPESP